jgi:hypothetical protein
MFGDSVDHTLGLLPNLKDCEELLQGPVTDDWIRDKIEKQSVLLESARKHQEEINDVNIQER